MKKILVGMFLLLFGFCLVGCTGPDTTKGGRFNVYYDYGTIEENKITILIDSCLSFFDFEDYNIKQLYPGDILYIDYTGKPIIEESYPGRMTGIEVSHVELYNRTIREVSEWEIVRNELNGISNVYNYSYTDEYVIINEELDYVPLSEYTGGTLYVSLDSSPNNKSSNKERSEPQPIPITAFFAFNPNDEKTYNLTIQNETDYVLEGNKDNYKAGEEVEIKMTYEDYVVTYVHLNGKNIGWLNGTNSLKFNMPNEDSVLTINYSEEFITVIHPEIKLFYSLQESFDNDFLTHEDLQQIANLNNNGPFNPVEIDNGIATLIMKDFCEMHNVDYEENGGSVRCFGEYNGYYAVMVDGCGFEYLTVITSEIADGIIFNYGSSQHILIWKYYE